MTDQERFEIGLRELGRLVLALGDLRENIKLIGGQVVALEDRARGRSGILQVELPSGPIISRGFSFDLDLLYDGDAEFQEERIPEILRKENYTRRGARWSKLVDGVVVDIDLLAPPGIAPPTEMTEAARGEVAASRVARLMELRVDCIEFQIPVPDAIGFLALKLGAKEVRPTASKDCFDIFAYVNLLGVAEVD